MAEEARDGGREEGWKRERERKRGSLVCLDLHVQQELHVHEQPPLLVAAALSPSFANRLLRGTCSCHSLATMSPTLPSSSSSSSLTSAFFLLPFFPPLKFRLPVRMVAAESFFMRLMVRVRNQKPVNRHQTVKNEGKKQEEKWEQVRNRRKGRG